MPKPKSRAPKRKQFQLVFQLPDVPFGAFLYFEERLLASVRGIGDIDGHDFGAGEGNVFVVTEDPERSFQLFAEKYPELLGSNSPIRIGSRPLDGDRFKVHFPKGLRTFVVA